VDPRAGQDAGPVGAMIPPLATLKSTRNVDYAAFTSVVLKMGHRAT